MRETHTSSWQLSVPAETAPDGERPGRSRGPGTPEHAAAARRMVPFAAEAGERKGAV